MGSLYSNADVRIAQDGRVWVMAPAGKLGRSAQWAQVPVAKLRLDADWPDDLISPYGRHGIGDLGIRIKELSHALGLPRRDPQRVRQLWTPPHYIRGSILAIDFDEKELAGDPSDLAALIYPFSCFAAITTAPPPRLLAKLRLPEMPGWLRVGDYPIGAEALARALGAKLVSDEPEWIDGVLSFPGQTEMASE